MTMKVTQGHPNCCYLIGYTACVIHLARAIPERIRNGLRRCAIQINVYFTYLLY